jgi:hypothetical protein
MNKQRLDFLNGVSELMIKIFGKDIFEISDYKDYLSITIYEDEKEEIKK